jgi:PAS domain S-box-containing protein
VTDDVLLDLNPAFEKLFGYPREEILGKKVGDIDFFSRPEDQQAVEENLRKLKPIYGLELELRDTAGIPLDLLLTVDYLSLGKEPCAIASFLDITERKRVESAIRESEIRLNEAQHIAQVGSWAIDLQDGTGSWSEQTFHILELDEFSTAPGVDAFLSRVHPEDHERVREITGRLAQTPGVREFTCRLLLPDGRIKHIANRVVTECDSAGNPRNIAGTLQDVTERVLFEELIHAQLVEKEVLLREIHHRVKNNLNIVSSMLYLQGAAAGEDRITALFEESRARVQAMALVHELLYQSGDMGRIDLKSYLEQLGQGLLASYSDGSAAVSIATDVSVPPVSIQVAIPCGLIVCELVTNALKYAFRGRAGGRIRVALAEREGRFVLGVADDGVGLAAARQARPGSIGLNLVQALADQLDGTLESRSDGGGTVFTVTFKVQESGR